MKFKVVFEQRHFLPRYILIIFLILNGWMLSSCRPALAPLTVVTSRPSLAAHTSTASPTTTRSLPTVTTPVPSATIAATPTVPATDTPQPSPTSAPHSPLIAFTMVQDGQKKIFTIRPDGTELTPLVPSLANSYHPQWSPDGRYVAFLSGASFETAHLFILDYETSQLQQIDYDGVITFTWSPNGQMLAFTMFTPIEGGDDYNVYLVSVPELKLTVLKQMARTKRIVSLYWSPKGATILAEAHFLRGAAYLFLLVFNLSGAYTSPETAGVAIQSVSWKPDGEAIAYSSYVPGEENYQIWIMDVDENKSKRIVSHQDDLYDLTWSPDGKFLAYANSGINIINLASGSELQVAPPEPFAHSPMWSPDEANLSFLEATDDVDAKGYSLNIYSFNTGETIKIVDGMLVGYAPVWRP